jgi:hypothetical protein
MPRSFLEVFHQALVRARARMWPADAPEPEYHLDAKPLSADALVDVVIQFNWDPLSQTDNVRVLKILDESFWRTRGCWSSGLSSETRTRTMPANAKPSEQHKRQSTTPRLP